jgi:hypothetical protein
MLPARVADRPISVLGTGPDAVSQEAAETLWQHPVVVGAILCSARGMSMAVPGQPHLSGQTPAPLTSGASRPAPKIKTKIKQIDFMRYRAVTGK